MNPLENIDKLSLQDATNGYILATHREEETYAQTLERFAYEARAKYWAYVMRSKLETAPEDFQLALDFAQLARTCAKAALKHGEDNEV